MAVIRISDSNFETLRALAAWFGTETPPQTVDAVITFASEKLGIVADGPETVAEEPETDQSPSGTPVPKQDHVPGYGSRQNPLTFPKRAPGLTFTKVDFFLVGSGRLRRAERNAWSFVLRSVLQELVHRGLTAAEICADLRIPASTDRRSGNGWEYYADLGISIQGSTAEAIWQEVSRIAGDYKFPVEVRVRWIAKKGAQYPGKIGRLTAGPVCDEAAA